MQASECNQVNATKWMQHRAVNGYFGMGGGKFWAYQGKLQAISEWNQQKQVNFKHGLPLIKISPSRVHAPCVHACTFCHLEGTNFAQPRYDMIQYKHKWTGVLPNKIADQSSYHFCNFSWKFQPQRENNAVNCGHYFYLAGLLLGKHKHSASSKKKSSVQCQGQA